MSTLGEGRASQILDLGGGRVLRRFKRGGDPAREALVMEHARAHGYPVPRVLEVRADGLVLERVDGPTMLAALRRRPWTIARHAAALAALHGRLHRIPFEGAALVHLDFHPDNVLLSPSGPVVIDWTNAGAGDPGVDLALTWVIGETSGVPARAFVRLYARRVDREALERGLPEAVARRLADPNLTEAERARVRRLLRG